MHAMEVLSKVSRRIPAIRRIHELMPIPERVVRKPHAYSFGPDIVRRSQLDRGDLARTFRAMDRARRGLPVCIGFIGGSITQGGSASKRELRYADLVKDWWEQTFPNCSFRYINAGVGATATNYGTHRAWDHVLHGEPDWVMVEFAVNDENEEYYGQTMEGLVRQIMKMPQQPALMMNFQMRNDGTNAQEWHSRVGRYYGAQMVSVRDALWPEIEAGRLAWSDVICDHIHPNDRGYRATADFIIAMLESALDALPPAKNLPPIAPMPVAPLLTRAFEKTVHLTPDKMQPALNHGWTKTQTPWGEDCIEATEVGAELVFELDCTSIHLLYYRARADYGAVEVQVDEQPPVRIDGWHGGAPHGLNFCYNTACWLTPGTHRFRMRVLDDKHPESAGNRFQLISVMAAREP